jgi:hypothetical protein
MLFPGNSADKVLACQFDPVAMASPRVQDFWCIHVLKVAGDGQLGDLLGKVSCHVGSDFDRKERFNSVSANFELVLVAGRYKVVCVDPDLDAVMNTKEILYKLLPPRGGGSKF